MPSSDISTDVPATEPDQTEQTDPESLETEPPVPSGEFLPKAMMYHLIMETPYNSLEALFVRPSDFDSQLSYLTENGYGFMFADEWQIADRPTVILTFDDGYVDNYTDMFPILKKYGAKATVFLISEMVGTDGYLSVDQIVEMASSGLVSFQCHTAHHVDLSYQDESTMRSEFSTSISKIENWTGRPVRALAYPAGSYNDDVIRVAADYFSFCYTTKSPYSVTEYSNYNIPRYYIARDLTDASFIGYMQY
ncbi:MAG: polysaccharide deacetylase family protein [Clostridia bacterium]|nr:polysaccharide deacetylase family protein [Clostridia bacterium]